MSEKETPDFIVIPENIIGSKRYLGFRRRNIIEALILAVVIFLIIRAIPFVPRIKQIFELALCPVTFMLGCVGIKDKSPSELFIDAIKYRTFPKKLHMNYINNVTKRKDTSIDDTTTVADSIADIAIKKAKRAYKNYKETGTILK